MWPITSAQHSGQLLKIEGKTCSLFGSFTISSSATLLLRKHMMEQNTRSCSSYRKPVYSGSSSNLPHTTHLIGVSSWPDSDASDADFPLFCFLSFGSFSRASNSHNSFFRKETIGVSASLASLIRLFRPVICSASLPASLPLRPASLSFPPVGNSAVSSNQRFPLLRAGTTKMCLSRSDGANLLSASESVFGSFGHCLLSKWGVTPIRAQMGHFSRFCPFSSALTH
jgi:hypothetical protein